MGDSSDLPIFQSRGSCFGPQSPRGMRACQSEDYLESFPASGCRALGQINEDEAFGVDMTPEPKSQPRSTTRSVPTSTCKTTYLCHQTAASNRILSPRSPPRSPRTATSPCSQSQDKRIVRSPCSIGNLASPKRSLHSPRSSATYRSP